MAPPYKVLIVDDSALVRKVLTAILDADDALEVVGAARDATMATGMIHTLNPDVLTLDIVMPGMDGLTFLERLMKSHPLPVVMVSTLTQENAPQTFRALELGAVEIVTKPKMDVSARLQDLSVQLVDKVKAAAQARIKSQHQLFVQPERAPPPPLVPSGTHARAWSGRASLTRGKRGVIAIGASTGGTDALRALLVPLPKEVPGIVIVQHMPALFTGPFAQRLDREATVTVREARDGDRLEPGLALLAPGDQHMRVRTSAGGHTVHLDQTALVNRHRPSVDVLFHSVARGAASHAMGIILTGMGADGADGLHAMQKAGAATVAQDEASCVVFGMPKMAIQAGAVDHTLPLTEIPAHIVQWVARRH